MLIVCAGPDTYRAREKARELEKAFREKYDPEGHAVESVDVSSSDQIHDRLYPLLSSGSLFSSRAFIRCDGSFALLKAKGQKVFVERTSTSADTIVVTVEPDAPSKKMEEFLKEKGGKVYSFPELKGREYIAWLGQQCDRLSLDRAIATKIAENTEGDSWLAMTELQKYEAYPNRERERVSTQDAEMKIFEITDALLEDKKGWRTRIAEFQDEGVVTTYFSQLRSYCRVQSGSAEGLHPYVQKKLSRMRVTKVSQKILSALRVLVFRRKGLIEDGEYETLL